MERLNQCGFALFFSSTIASALLTFALCLAAEFKKSKKNDLILDGKHCYLPRSHAFELGIAALICLSITQITANLFVCRKLLSREKGSGDEVRKPMVSYILLVFSWICFGTAIILISAATNMSKSQPYGEGWLGGKCYLVKDGVYVGSAILTLLALGSITGSAIIRLRHRQADENTRVHAHIDE